MTNEDLDARVLVELRLCKHPLKFADIKHLIPDADSRPLDRALQRLKKGCFISFDSKKGWSLK